MGSRLGVGNGGSVVVASGVPVGTGSPPALACLTTSEPGRAKNTTSNTAARTRTPEPKITMRRARRFSRDRAFDDVAKRMA